jgi:hypothetical protein
MRPVAKARIAAVSLTAGVALAGCSSGSSSTTAPPITAASSATAAATASSASSATTAAATASSASSAATVAGAPSSASGAAAGGTCQPGGLTASLGPVLGSAVVQTNASSRNPALGQNQYDQIVELTNSGSAACTLDGYPGVNLEGAANGSSTYQWPLQRSTASYSTVTLAPGESAHFGLVYLPLDSSDSGGSIKVTTIIVTPPNDFSSKRLSWSKTLLLQDAATSPGTWITPVQAGSGAS